MKAMLFSDLITARNSFPALLGITVFAAAFIAVGSGMTVAAVGCMAAMVPFMYLFSIAAYDEWNGWERFRLTLPLSRRQVAYGRYASMLVVTACALAFSLAIGLLIGGVAQALPAGVVPESLSLDEAGLPVLATAGMAAALVVLLTSAVTLPLVMRFGMTSGTRLVPVVLVLAVAAGMVLLGGESTLDVDELLTSAGPSMAMAVAAVVALALYGASALLAARLYEQREL